MRKQLIHKRNLWQYKTAITDTSNLSPKYFNFTEFPNILTSGKNVIKIKLNEKYMDVGTPLYIEILDANGELVYFEVLDKLEEDLSRVISIYVYEDTASGDAQFTILGTAKKGPNNERVNNSVPNVKFNKLITINKEQRNSSEIIYDDGNQPNISVIERLIPYQERLYNSGYEVTQSAGTVSYKNGIVTANGFNFTKDMLSGSLVVTSPTGSYPDTNLTADKTFRTTITEIYNATQVKVSPLYSISSSNFQKHNFTKFDNSNYTITYNETGSLQTTENKKSYAYVKVNNLQPDTGDVRRIKANFKSSGETKNQWEQIDDIEVTATNLLVDSSSNNPLLNYGEIVNQGHIDTYYTLTNIGGNTNTSMSFDSSSLFNSIKTEINQVLSSSQYFYIQPTQSVDFYTGHEYVLSYKAYSKTNVSHSGTPILEIFASGSAFKNNDNTDNLGKYLSTNTAKVETRYDLQNIQFTPDQSGDGKITFKVKSGEWYISEIQLKSYNEQGFTPDQIVGIFSVPTKYRNDRIDLQFEYYNYKNQQSTLKTEVKDLIFTGSNFYIQGDDNLVTGSTFVGTQTQGGLEMFGNQGGGYMRTFGYGNFATESIGSGSGGVMIYSGSTQYGSQYGGMGMEMFTPDALHGMYFGSYHGMYQRPGFNEYYSMDGGVLSGVPTNGRGDIIYGFVSASNGPGSAMSVKADGTWVVAGTYGASDPEFPGGTGYRKAQGISLTGGTGSNQPILVRGLFQNVSFTFVPGGSVYMDDVAAFTGSFTATLPTTSPQLVGTAFAVDTAFFDFINSEISLPGSIVG